MPTNIHKAQMNRNCTASFTLYYTQKKKNKNMKKNDDKNFSESESELYHFGLHMFMKC